MPLRDHFNPPGENLASWEEVHGLWPGVITLHLNRTLPKQYRCGLKVHIGTQLEVDVATYETDRTETPDQMNPLDYSWQSESSTLLLETDELTPAEYEVRVYDQARGQRLVAAIELISPSNKDRLQSRNAFVDKCHALLQQDVCVILVDIVTNYSRNLYAELAERLGALPPAIADSNIYAVTCRTRMGPRGVRIETWERLLKIGSSLPSLPIWLSETLPVNLDLEGTYEETCTGLRIP